MKKPDEIKKGLAICVNDNFGCNERCSYFGCESNGVDCASDMHEDALAYIQQLESRLAQVERERDAAVTEIKRMEAKAEELREMVNDTIHRELPYSDYLDFINQVDTICNYQFENEWRGVCDENTKEE